MRMQSRQDSLCNQTMEYQVMPFNFKMFSRVDITRMASICHRPDRHRPDRGNYDTRTYGTLVIREFAEE